MREPILEGDLGSADAAQRLVAAFGTLLPAVTDLVAHHFRRVLLREREERFGDESDVLEAGRA